MIVRYLRALLAALKPPPVPTRTPPASDHPVYSEPMWLAFESALKDIGEREDPWGSNTSAWLEAIRAEANMPQLGKGAWCALFATIHMQRAGLGIRSRSAKRLVHQVAREGRVVHFNDLTPGLCGLSLHRRSGGWHVRLWRCEEDERGLVICCVGGNEKHAVRDEKYRAEAYCAMAKTMATV